MRGQTFGGGKIAKHLPMSSEGQDMIVTFCGHSKINTGWNKIRAQLSVAVEKLIQEGAALFFSGGYGDFDWMAASVLHELKGRYPHIQSILVLAYLNREQDWDEERHEAWEEDLKLYDGTVYPPLESVPKRLAIVRRNAWMVDEADVAAAYVCHSWGGAAKTLEYAQRKGKRIISLDDRK